MSISENQIDRYRGDTYSIEATIKKDEIPLDLSGADYDVVFGYKKGKKKNLITGINGNINGEISFPFPAIVSPGQYVYDIQVTDNTLAGNNEIQTYVKDILNIIDDVSR